MDNMDMSLISTENLPRRRKRSVSPSLKNKKNDEKKEKSKCEKLNIAFSNILQEYFLDHPQQVNMTYFQHFKRAMGMAIQTGMATAALLVHSVIPKFFPHTGSTIVKQMNLSIKEFEDKLINNNN